MSWSLTDRHSVEGRLGQTESPIPVCRDGLVAVFRCLALSQSLVLGPALYLYAMARETQPISVSALTRDIRGRLKELEPLVEEYERLQQAEKALARTGPRASSGSWAVRGAATGPPRRRRAARGAVREALLQAVSERPGASAAEIAGAAEVDKRSGASGLRRLVQNGAIEKIRRPEGGVGFRLPDTHDTQEATS
jgi:hypothetical protein